MGSITSDGVAVIDIQGQMSKFGSSLSDSIATLEIREQICRAAQNDRVSAILLRIDSPGGEMAGTKDLADDVALAAAKKRLWAYIEDSAVGMAYWVASQAEKVFCNPTALVGSIGTFDVLRDSSKAAENKGIKVHVIRAGKFKGAGTPGTIVTDEHLAQRQGLIDSLNKHFLTGVARGRKMPLSQVRQLADGRAHVGAAAHRLGLVDGIKTFDQVLQEISSKTKSNGSTKIMSNQPATMKELKAACPGADSGFLVAQIEVGATAAQARMAWMIEQNKRLQAATADAAAQKRQRAQSGSSIKNRDADYAAGDDAGSDYGEDAIEAFNTAVCEVMDRQHLTRQQAIVIVATKKPNLHKEFLLASNPDAKSRRLIEEKYAVE